MTIRRFIGCAPAWRVCSFTTEDSNAEEGHGFDAIVAALKQRFSRSDWVLRVHKDYRHDQRLAGVAAQLPGLSTRLPLRP